MNASHNGLDSAAIGELDVLQRVEIADLCANKITSGIVSQSSPFSLFGTAPFVVTTQLSTFPSNLPLDVQPPPPPPPVSFWSGNRTLRELRLDGNALATDLSFLAFPCLVTLSLNDNAIASIDNLRVPDSLITLSLARNGLASLAGEHVAAGVRVLDIVR